MKYEIKGKILQSVGSSRMCNKYGKIPNRIIEDIDILIEIVHSQQQEIDELKKVISSK